MEPNRVEAESLLSIAEKLLQARDLVGSRDFAVLAQEEDPLLDGSDQIAAVADVLLAADKRLINNLPDWYSILQIEPRSDDPDLIRNQYRRLALLLHPDKNKAPLADQAFKLVSDAWSVLSDPPRKSLYDREADPQTPNSGDVGFWTACPYCYTLFEYHRVYEGCCLRCQNCKRAFQGVEVDSVPATVPGQEAYYCCWGFFPIGYVAGNCDGKANAPAAPAGGFPNWMPPMFLNGNATDLGKKRGR